MNKKIALTCVIILFLAASCNGPISVKRWVYNDTPPDEKGDVTMSGTLICLNCFFDQTDEARAFCAANGHQHVLRAVDERLFTIVRDGKSKELIESENYHNKAVTITGRIIEKSRAIKVSSFETF
ncbi:MAG: hypothetical protein HZA77_06450 [Candidatus Schekmanbacteria bacterium]|nr:hypothetical protein [Candidatus Schekmanbacteria bacterium]